jgi:energy-coupling factor transport system ATP-binding protein
MGLRISRLSDLNYAAADGPTETASDGFVTGGLAETASGIAADGGLKMNNLSIMRGKKTLLGNLSLEFHPGEIVAITGRNGLGKTTFIRTITGLHKEYSGEIYLDNKLLKPKELCKQSYLVMQDVNYQLFAESVREECTLGMKGIDKKRVDEVLEVLGLLPFADRHPNTLSGGQKQRLALAVSMISDRKIIALDEPTSGLDYDNMVRTGEIVKELAKDGKIIIIVTHDKEFISSCCTRVVRLG